MHQTLRVWSTVIHGVAYRLLLNSSWGAMGRQGGGSLVLGISECFVTRLHFAISGGVPCATVFLPTADTRHTPKGVDFRVRVPADQANSP